MSGFLDKDAPSPAAEYVRFLEGDVFGKILLKSYLLRVIGLSEEQIRIPIGKWGDIGSLPTVGGDAMVRLESRWLSIEVKLARLNIANKTKGYTEPNWAFNNILQSPSKHSKIYDILFAVGVNVLGFENPRYWDHFRNSISKLSNDLTGINDTLLPHEPAFLNLCGAFIIPFSCIPTNHFRVTLRTLGSSPYQRYFSWLTDSARARYIWAEAVASGRSEKEGTPRVS